MFVTTKPRRSGSARIYVGNYKSRIEGDAPTVKLREELSYVDPKVIEFQNTGMWGQAVLKELEELKAAADGLGVMSDDQFSRKKGRMAAKKKYQEARRLASTVYLYDSATHTFPTTLLREVCKILRGEGIKYDLVDDMTEPEPTLDVTYTMPEGHAPRPYQNRAVEIAAHTRCGVFALATNAGKTTIMERIIAQRHYKTLILVQKADLMYQIQESIRRSMHYEAGLLGDGEFTLRDITVAIVNSACNKITELKEYGFDMVFVDEGHHAASKIHAVVLAELQPYCAYSMTGTPFRTNSAENIKLRAAFGGVVQHITNQFMVKEGYSARIRAEIYKCKQELHPSMNWARVYKQAVIESRARHEVLIDAIVRHVEAEKTVLLLTDQTSHGAELHRLLVNRGINARFMHGSKQREDRMAARLDFKERRFDVLVGTTIYDEGVDFPTLDVVAFAGGKKAKGKILQRIGRGQRTGLHKDGSRKDTAVVIDVFDEGHYTLKSHSLRRLLAMYDAGVVLPKEYTELLVSEGYSHGHRPTGSSGLEGRHPRKPARRRDKARHLLQPGGRDVPGEGREEVRDGGQGGEGGDAPARTDQRAGRRRVRGKARQA